MTVSDLLWEVFVQEEGGEPHVHVGSVRAVDKEFAIQNARDVYARRGQVVSIWVVPTESISATTPSDTKTFFSSADDKAYRHPQFYKVPKEFK